MKKYKICVYAICKNEGKFIERWYNSIKDADYICVLDTGSVDNTVDLLEKFKINYKIKKIDPWRFDSARNESLKLIPDDADICISLDIDIEYIEGLSLNTEKLKIPHPKIKERAFVLVPVLEILDKTADEKLMEEFSSYLQNLPDAKDLVKI